MQSEIGVKEEKVETICGRSRTALETRWYQAIEKGSPTDVVVEEMKKRTWAQRGKDFKGR